MVPLFPPRTQPRSPARALLFSLYSSARPIPPLIARERALSVEEYERLLTASSLHLRGIIVCAYETGMRRGEIQSLTWNRVDLKAGLIRLEGEDTKTGEGRIIPISPTLRAALEELHQEVREGGPD